VLQKALKDALPDQIVQLRKRLVSLEQLPKGGVRLAFEDGTTADADLVIGADGIRSVGLGYTSVSTIADCQAVRKVTYPSYETQYNGESGQRAELRAEWD
jgi:NAD(P)H-nitrite reductase large subunit